MIGALATGLIIGALVVAAWCVGMVILNKPVNDPTLGLLALLEIGLLVQSVIGIAKLVGTDRGVSGATFVGYLVATLVILPLATFWSLAERSRWGTTVVIIGCLVIPVLIVRLNQIWEPARV